MKDITITAQDVHKACAIISAFADTLNAPIETAPAAPVKQGVSPYFDEAGVFLGARVTGMGEDFVIEAQDFNDGKELNWSETMKALKEAGKTTWTYRQICLTMFYSDEIDEILKKNGGQPLNNWYWTAAEYSANYAFYYTGIYGNLNNGIKNGTCSSRALLAL